MSLSGVLLNHSNLISKFSVANFLVPDSYRPNNWNRSTIKNILNTKQLKNDSLLLYGNQGVFISDNKGKGIKAYMVGEFPTSPRLKRTNYILADTVFNRLLAATNGGLFICNKQSDKWNKVASLQNHDDLLKIFIKDSYVLVISKSALYLSEHKQDLQFERLLPNKTEKEETASLIALFFALHDGSILGLPGKILWDIVAIIMFFLCLSAFYLWFYPKKWKRNYKRKKHRANKKEKNNYAFFLKYHKQLGKYSAIILLIIIFTGMCLRPPLIMLLFKGQVSKKWLSAVENTNPWHHKIRNALYDSSSDKLVLDCSDGIWAGHITDNPTFEKQDINLPIFAMGATVFCEEQPNQWLIGSFGGLFSYNTKTKATKSLLDVEQPKGKGRPSSILVTGYIQAPDNNRYVLGHYKGLCNLKGKPKPNVIQMPQSITQNYRMPLWNFFFELHNARIFKGILGGFYILIIPLGGLLSLLMLLSGIISLFRRGA